MVSPSALVLGVLLASHIEPAAAGTQDHFILTRLAALTWARLDPIVNPGAVSGHVHNVAGGSCFGATPNTPEQQENCDCSTVVINDDMSNYWAPALYYQSTDGKFSPMLGGTRVYYFTKGDDVKPFPKGLRMISGTAMQRNDSDTRTLGLRIACNHKTQTKLLPNGTSHPDGCNSVSMGIFFPSCGLATGDLDSADHFSHMAWPQSQLGGGAAPFDDPNNSLCPESHPIKYPAIFMEQNYYLTDEQPWHDGNPVVLSNGDTSGLAFHADFQEGWKGTVLADTLKQCGQGHGPGDQLQECPPLAKSFAEWKTWDCRLQSQIPDEDVGLYRSLDALPGCNKVWLTTDPDTKPECKEDNPPGFVYPNAEFVNLPFRMHLPMLFTEAKNLSDYWAMKQYIPELGNASTSSVQPWGQDASNKASLNSSTVAEIEALKNGPDPDELTNSTAASAMPASLAVNATSLVVPAAQSASATSATSAKIANANIALADGTAGSAPSASANQANAAGSSSASTTSAAGKTCKWV